LFHTRLPRPPTDGRTEGKKPKKKEGKKKAETETGVRQLLASTGSASSWCGECSARFII